MMRLITQEDWLKQNVHSQEGITPQQEARLRFETAQFIQSYTSNLSKKFENLEQRQIRSLVMKSLVIFNRVAAQISFKKFDRQLFGAVCVFLVAKDETIFLQLQDSVKIYLLECHNALMEKQWVIEGKTEECPDLINTTEQTKLFMEKLEERKCIGDEVAKFCETEAEILQYVGYDLDIYVTQQFIKAFIDQHNIKNPQFINQILLYSCDIYTTSLSLYYDPIILTLTTINLALLEMKLKGSVPDEILIPQTPDDKPWYMTFTEYSNDEKQVLNDMNEATQLVNDFFKAISKA